MGSARKAKLRSHGCPAVAERLRTCSFAHPPAMPARKPRRRHHLVASTEAVPWSTAPRLLGRLQGHQPPGLRIKNPIEIKKPKNALLLKFGGLVLGYIKADFCK